MNRKLFVVALAALLVTGCNQKQSSEQNPSSSDNSTSQVETSTTSENSVTTSVVESTTSIVETTTSVQQGPASTYGVAGNKDDAAQSKIIDLKEGKKVCPAYVSSDKNVTKDITINGEAYKETNCYNSSNVDYWQFGSKKYTADAWLANQVAVPGNIVGIILSIPTGASGNTRYHFGFATEAMNQAYNEGEPIKPVSEGSQSALTSDVEMIIVPSQAGNYKYFNITAQYLEKNPFNGGASKITVLYR